MTDKLLENHIIWEMMDLSSSSDNVQSTRASQLVTTNNSLMFAWNNKKSCIYYTSISSQNIGKEPVVNTLLCNDAPLFEVKRIICMKDSSHIALVGSRGLSVVKLPKQIFVKPHEVKEDVVCQTIAVGERFFITNITVQLLQASWHPTSNKPAIFILSSDNFLRLFSLNNPQTASHYFNLDQSDSEISSQSSHSSMNHSLFSKYSMSTCLGETAVSFDFGQEIDYKPFKSSFLNKDQEDYVLLQQIYILKGNGDVLLLLIDLYHPTYSKGVLLGPLIMLPQAADNYGTDSCSILVTKTTPPMIAIATKTNGRVHHCVALHNNQDQFSAEGMVPSKRMEMILNEEDNAELTLEPTLYVYETVQLDIVPHNLEQNEEMQEYFIDLFHDPSLPWRYYCCTCVGVHSISLPWLQQFNMFMVENNNKQCEISPQISEQLINTLSEDACLVEHMICTKPTSASSPCNVAALTIINNNLAGPNMLLCVTNDNHCTALSLLSTLRGSHPDLSLNESSYTNSSLSEQTLKAENSQIFEQDFDKHVKNILKRESSQPILRSGSGDSDQIAVEGEHILLESATCTLRDEYMHKLQSARQTIVKRIQLIKEHKEIQIREVKDLNRIRNELTDSAEKIANDFEDMKERQEMLMLKISRIISSSKSQQFNPILSRAEINMGKELRKISTHIKKLDNSIKQVKIKHKYQVKQISNKQSHTPDNLIAKSEKYGSNVSQMTKTALQNSQLTQILLEEGDKIHELIKKLNNLNVQVGL